MFNFLRCFAVIFLGWFSALHVGFAAGNLPVYSLRNCQIIKVDDNTLVGLKRLPYKKYNSTATESGAKPSIEIDDVYFVFERLTPYNIGFWSSYQEEQHDKTVRMDVRSANGTVVYIGDGLGSFRKTIEMLSQSEEFNYSIWIVYATRKNPLLKQLIPVQPPYQHIPFDKTQWPEDKKAEYTAYRKAVQEYNNAIMDYPIKRDDIEMVVSVFANSEALITTHMGIFRNYKYFANKQEPHQGLALEIHGFAAAASKQLYPQIQYMVTNPAIKMKELIIEKLAVGQDVWLGATRERQRRLQRIANLGDDERLLQTFQNKKSEIRNHFKRFKSIDTYDQQQFIKAQESLRAYIDALSSYFQKTPTLTELKAELELGWRSNIFKQRYNEAIHTKLKNIINVAEVTDMRSADIAITNWISNFDYDKIAALLATERNTLQFQITERAYLPSEPEDQAPLDNMDEQNWRIFSPEENTWLSFRRPAWFRFMHNNQSNGHDDLLNHLPTIIVTNQSLRRVWETDRALS